MSGLTQILNVGFSGLNAALEAMQTVSNNTANVNTTGYNVESVSQTAVPGIGTGSGNGVNVSGIQRAFDQFAYVQMVQAGSASQAAQTVQTNAENLAALFPVASGGANGLGASLTGFFSAVNLVAQNPASVSNRSSLLSSATSLTDQFNSIGGELASSLAGLNQQVGGSVQQINQLVRQIAVANGTVVAQSAGGNGAPNSLLDARDNLVQQLAQQVGVTVLQGNNGALDIYTAGGVALVNGSSAATLAATPSVYGDVAVGITAGTGGQDITNAISGGALGGLLTSRSQVVDAQDAVGAIAVGLSAAVNTQQSLGLDLNGQLGKALFSVAAPSVHPAQSNTGSGVLSATITDPTGFSPTDFVLTRTAAGFEATNLTNGQVTSLGSGPSLSLDGLTVTVSGSVALGDSFKLEPTADAAQSFAVATKNPAAIAAASPYVVTAGSNAGTVQANSSAAPAPSGSLGASAVVLPASDFGQTLKVSFTSATTFQVFSSSNAVLASGSFNPATGAQIAVAYPAPPAPAGEVAVASLGAGNAAAGDSFTIAPAGVGDGGNIALLAGLGDQPLISGQSLSSAYGSLVSAIGSNGQTAEVAAQAAQAVLTRTQAVQQSVSGVNLDEQAADLVSFQQAYQASATVIAATQTLFQSLLSAVNA